VGFAWYRPEQWARLRELASDTAQIEETHEAWLSTAERTEADVRALGIVVERVAVDVDEIADWCNQDGRAFDSTARAEYVAEAMHRRFESSVKRGVVEQGLAPDEAREERVHRSTLFIGARFAGERQCSTDLVCREEQAP
jgi:hypothetical protein